MRLSFSHVSLLVCSVYTRTRITRLLSCTGWMAANLQQLKQSLLSMTSSLVSSTLILQERNQQTPDNTNDYLHTNWFGPQIQAKAKFSLNLCYHSQKLILILVVFFSESLEMSYCYAQATADKRQRPPAESLPLTAHWNAPIHWTTARGLKHSPSKGRQNTL